MELDLTSELTSSRDYYSDHLDLAYALGNATEEALELTISADFQRYEAAIYAQQEEVERAHVEEAVYNEKYTEWEVQKALNNYLIWTNTTDEEDAKMTPYCYSR